MSPLMGAATLAAGRRRRLARGVGASALLALVVWTAGCASTAPPLETALRERAGGPVLRFAEDTLAFPNEVRALNPGREDLYANYCFVMTRGVGQFLKFARFAPERPKLSPDEYAGLVRRVTSHPLWKEALPPDDRVVIPGYRNLREFSREQEAAVKAGLGSKFWTLMHWTNWRAVFSVSGAHQERVASEVVAELRGGRPVLLLVTNWPAPELNHGVVAYALRGSDQTIDFSVYDPNEPGRPGILSFQGEERRFWATDLFDTRPGPIRAFRMYHSPLL